MEFLCVIVSHSSYNSLEVQKILLIAEPILLSLTVQLLVGPGMVYNYFGRVRPASQDKSNLGKWYLQILIFLVLHKYFGQSKNIGANMGVFKILWLS